eukprot:CAMPEP_0168523524 /NCGR_PEP_ID=MMETSP0405-20121227/10032_1 /TAXON_ID=498012 /ORGANISM="Trichosphaerium sp, Strain Am-I-7 wt" /LENGTH=295 /DNA_ID=CAMNT_0008545409 /DNA_START=164 /DNA_END=1051 /DNA_ORIENTATION=-
MIPLNHKQRRQLSSNKTEQEQTKRMLNRRKKKPLPDEENYSDELEELNLEMYLMQPTSNSEGSKLYDIDDEDNEVSSITMAIAAQQVSSVRQSPRLRGFAQPSIDCSPKELNTKQKRATYKRSNSFENKRKFLKRPAKRDSKDEDEPAIKRERPDAPEPGAKYAWDCAETSPSGSMQHTRGGQRRTEHLGSHRRNCSAPATGSSNCLYDPRKIKTYPPPQHLVRPTAQKPVLTAMYFGSNGAHERHLALRKLRHSEEAKQNCLRRRNSIVRRDENLPRRPHHARQSAFIFVSNNE